MTLDLRQYFVSALITYLEIIFNYKSAFEGLLTLIKEMAAFF